MSTPQHLEQYWHVFFLGHHERRWHLMYNESRLVNNALDDGQVRV
jgi:hypothetical protein